MRRTILLSRILLAILLLAGCGRPKLELASADMLPTFLDTASPRVRDAYRFAVAQPHDLEMIPCYCGCGKMGHTSNLSCYVKSGSADGTIVFDEHAGGCGICVDITQDVMRMTQDGQHAWEIRTYIDAQYSPYGPATDTPLPEKS